MRRLEARVRRLERLFESKGPILDLRPVGAGTFGTGEAVHGATDRIRSGNDDAGARGRHAGGVDHG